MNRFFQYRSEVCCLPVFGGIYRSCEWLLSRKIRFSFGILKFECIFAVFMPTNRHILITISGVFYTLM